MSRRLILRVSCLLKISIFDHGISPLEYRSHINTPIGNDSISEDIQFLSRERNIKERQRIHYFVFIES